MGANPKRTEWERELYMKRMAVACAVVLALLLAMPTAGADVDTGMEGLWTGSTGGGQLTLLLGSGGTFISIYQADETYRQAGLFSVDTDNMYLTMSDGSSSTLAYGFAEGFSAYPERDWMWNSSGSICVPGRLYRRMGRGYFRCCTRVDRDGRKRRFASVDAETGETAKGIYLPDQGDLLVAYQDGTSMQVGISWMPRTAG